MSNNELVAELQHLQDKLAGQIKRKEYELALRTTEDLIEIYTDNNIDEFSLQKWLNYYEEIKTHHFKKTIDEKIEVLYDLITNQEIITIKKFQSLMKLNYIDDFHHLIQSMEETSIFEIRERRIEFYNPENIKLSDEIRRFLSNLHMVIQ